MIFISYRRDDESYFVNHLYDAMANAFGKKRVLMDIDSIPLAVDFRDFVSAQIRTARVTIAVVGPRWETAVDRTTNQPRILSTRDYVRCELEAAHAAKIPIVPIYVSRDADLDERVLPESLRFFPYLNGLVIERNDAVQGTFRKLKESLETMLRQPSIGPTPESNTWAVHRGLLNGSFTGTAIDNVPFAWTFIPDPAQAAQLQLVAQGAARVVRLSSSGSGAGTLLQRLPVASAQSILKLEVDLSSSVGSDVSVYLDVVGTPGVAIQATKPERHTVSMETVVSAGSIVDVGVRFSRIGDLQLYGFRLWRR